MSSSTIVPVAVSSENSAFAGRPESVTVKVSSPSSIRSSAVATEKVAEPELAVTVTVPDTDPFRKSSVLVVLSDRSQSSVISCACAGDTATRNTTALPSEAEASATDMLLTVWSLSFTDTDADPFVLWAEYPVPDPTVAVMRPFGSSVSSSSVATVKVAVPDVPTVTVCAPVPPVAKLPLSVTVTATEMFPVGAGLAVRVNSASCPSVISAPAEIETTGVSGGGSSLSLMVSVWTFSLPTVYPVPAVSVRITVSFDSSCESSMIATRTFTLVVPAVTLTAAPRGL